MGIPRFENERDLYGYLKAFLDENPNAVQLDGSDVSQSSRVAVILIWFQPRRCWYRLHGDTKVEAIKHFMREFEANPNSPVLVVSPKSKNPKKPSIIVRGSTSPNGWYCYEHGGGTVKDLLKKKAA